MKMLKNLAPLSSKYTFVKGSKNKPPHIGTTRFDGHTSSCMQQMHERKTILKEVKNLSLALIKREERLEATMQRLKDEKKCKKKAQKKTSKKQDEVQNLKQRIVDLRKNEDLLIQDL